MKFVCVLSAVWLIIVGAMAWLMFVVGAYDAAAFVAVSAVGFPAVWFTLLYTGPI